MNIINISHEQIILKKLKIERGGNDICPSYIVASTYVLEISTHKDTGKKVKETQPSTWLIMNNKKRKKEYKLAQGRTI